VGRGKSSTVVDPNAPDLPGANDPPRGAVIGDGPVTNPTLTPDQRQDFELRGVVRLEGLISAEGARRAREAVLRPLEQIGLWRDGAWNLDAVPPARWPLTGPKTASTIGHRHPELRALIEEPRLAALIQDLIGDCSLDPSQHPQVLFTLPNLDHWTKPCGWHVDLPRLASGRSPGVQIFTFIDPVEAGGAAPLAVAGSHLLLNDRGGIRSKDIRRGIEAEPFFRDFYVDVRGAPSDREAFLARRARVHGVEVGLVEMTGRPVDVWLMDLRTLHASAPNTSSSPRLMMTHRFVRADVADELAEAYGWT
jgi:hypothetical protein